MNDQVKFIATGDLFMTRRLPKDKYEGFEKIRECILRHDVRFSNLEMTFHDREGYPAAESGGTWAMMESRALDDVLEFGFNLYATANNHSGDYGAEGVLANIRHLRERDMIFSGTGENLSEASKACYLETKNARIALISACSTFHAADVAGEQTSEMIGRPGLNPLRFKTRFHVEEEYYQMLQKLSKVTGINDWSEFLIRNGYKTPLPSGTLSFGGAGEFVLDTTTWKETIPDQKDLKRITDEIKEAKRQADVVLVSMHSHESLGADPSVSSMFMEYFSHACIDAGANVIMGHGPHELRGIELYKDGVIFYSLGNFLFETETVSVQPADAFGAMGLSPNTKIGEYMNLRSKNGTVGYAVQNHIWNSIMAGWTMKNDKIKEIHLYPIDLGMRLKRSQKGVPKMGEEDILSYLNELCKPYGTKIEIRNGIGTIVL